MQTMHGPKLQTQQMDCKAKKKEGYQLDLD